MRPVPAPSLPTLHAKQIVSKAMDVYFFRKGTRDRIVNGKGKWRCQYPGRQGCESRLQLLLVAINADNIMRCSDGIEWK
jgi:hypothetical protein